MTLEELRKVCEEILHKSRMNLHSARERRTLVVYLRALAKRSTQLGDAELAQKCRVLSDRYAA